MTIKGFNQKTASKQFQPAGNLANNSGAGKDAPVLDIVAKRFNWGACLLSWIWGLGNRSYITLIVFPIAILGIIPVLGILIQIGVIVWFGINGNKWAWQNKKWNSIEEFHSVQKKWAIAAGIVEGLILILIPAIIIMNTLPTLLSSTDSKANSISAMMDVSHALQATTMNEIQETKCELTGEGLANCFAKEIKDASQFNNQLQTTNGSTWTFEANGVCKEEGDCQIVINTEDNNTITLPIYVKDDGYVEIKAEDAEKYIK